MNDVLLTIDQAAQLVGITRVKLRHWELRYHIALTRTAGNHRRYSQTQVDTRFKIKNLYDAGYALKGLKARLSTENSAS
jgi:excisionase family DNA binding protein